MNLTPRELQVARLFALGRTWEQIMAELGVGFRSTVARHRENALRKADVSTMPELWAKLGWLTVPDSDGKGCACSVVAVTRHRHSGEAA